MAGVMHDYILLTGATGFVGLSLIREWLATTDHRFYLLIRQGRDGENIRDRFRRHLAAYLNPAECREAEARCVLLAGDVAERQLGLPDADYHLLKKRLTYIYHTAAVIQFNLRLAEARRVNTGGTRNVLELGMGCLREGRLKRVIHLSTAYIAGNYRGSFRETDLDVGQGFGNTYEQSKFEAEKIVRTYMKKGLPVTVFRPSLISSHSVTGATVTRSLPCVFARYYARGRISAFCAQRYAEINLVPVDYVTGCMRKILMRDDSAGKTFHLVNRRNTGIAQLFDWISRYPGMPPLKEPDPCRERTLPSVFRPVGCYLDRKFSFDNKITCAFLRESDPDSCRIDLPYMTRFLDYCLSREWLRPHKRKEDKMQLTLPEAGWKEKGGGFEPGNLIRGTSPNSFFQGTWRENF